jgi:tetratricopeptide (TPR) repeat protein
MTSNTEMCEWLSSADYNGAVSYYSQKLKKSTDIYSAEYAHTLRNLGVFQSYLCEHKEAIANTHRSIEILKKIDPSKLDDIYCDMATAFIAYEKYDEALMYLELCKVKSDNVLNIKGVALMRTGNLRFAHTTLHDALSIRERKCSSTLHISTILNNIGDVLILMGKYTFANVYLQMATNLQKKKT